jgi:hypothetical protein
VVAACGQKKARQLSAVAGLRYETELEAPYVRLILNQKSERIKGDLSIPRCVSCGLLREAIVLDVSFMACLFVRHSLSVPRAYGLSQFRNVLRGTLLGIERIAGENQIPKCVWIFAFFPFETVRRPSENREAERNEVQHGSMELPQPGKMIPHGIPPCWGSLWCVRTFWGTMMPGERR